jgi:diguanylate cyclase (GGDEF)-like protein
LLPQADETTAMQVAERVRTTISGTTGDGSDSLIRIPVRVSMGVAQLSDTGTLDSLIRAADAALYRAKHAGRDTVST